MVLSGGGMDEAEWPPSGAAPMLVLVTHGTSDSVVSLGTGQATAAKLKAEGHDVRWLEFPGQHQIPAVVREALVGFLRGDEVGVAAP